jgi:hypothetical protein
MVLIFIQAPQLQKVPRNLKDIRVGPQVCVTDANANANAVANGAAIIPFRNKMETSVK